MLKLRQWLLAFAIALGMVGVAAAQSNSIDDDRCTEITTMSQDVFDQISTMNKNRIKLWIRPAAKLYKADCLRTIISRFGGLGRIMQFLQSGGSIWARIGQIDIGGMLCKAVLDGLPDDWNGDRSVPAQAIEPWSVPVEGQRDRERRELVQGVA